MKTEEKATIEIEIFRDAKGRHVCRSDSSHICRFLGNARFGTEQYCMLGEQRRLYYWDDNPAGYIMPVCGLADLQK